MENRFNQLLKHDDEHSREVLEAAQHDVSARWQMYQYLAERKGPTP
jgi:pyruvate-ferredoxin/flavodoxin oxidoreductase